MMMSVTTPTIFRQGFELMLAQHPCAHIQTHTQEKSPASANYGYANPMKHWGACMATTQALGTSVDKFT